MIRIPIQLQGMDDITHFVSTLSSFSCDMDLISGNRIVDAKSLMGVIAISEAMGLHLAIYDDSSASIDDIFAAIKPYVLEKSSSSFCYTA